MRISSIKDIQDLVITGFDNWGQFGCVYTKRMDNLILFKYTNEAQYKGEWNFFERVSRGLILDVVTGEIVARPFDKFFNWFERGMYSNGHIVNITEKMDGSLGILYRHDGEYKVATPGSFNSEQAIWATEYLAENYNLSSLDPDLTLLFEIIYPGNRVVVDYGRMESLVLLAARNRHTGDYLPFFPDVYQAGDYWGFYLPQTYTFNDVTTILEMTGIIDANSEGYVAEFSDGTRWKFKGDRYLELHKLVTGLSFKKVLRAMQQNTLKPDILDVVPDEFLGQVKVWVDSIQDTVNATHQSICEAYDKAPRDDRKSFAQYVVTHHHNLSLYLFAMLDGRYSTQMILDKYDFTDITGDHTE